MSRPGALLDGTGGDPDPPLIAGMMVGVRAWDVDLADAEDCRLLGFGDFPWCEGGLATVAECGGNSYRQSEARCPSAPGPDCGCGLYALHPWSRRLHGTHRRREPSRVPGGFRVAGAIQAWGRMELYEDGFRAEKARPIAIVLPKEPLEEGEHEAFVELARRYRIPALRPSSSQRAQRFAMSRAQVSSVTVEELVEGRDLEQTGAEWNRMEELVPVPATPSSWQPVRSALGAALRAVGTAINAVLNFAYFLLMAFIGLLMWVFILSMWLPLIGGIIYVLWLIASGTFEMIFG